MITQTEIKQKIKEYETLLQESERTEASWAAPKRKFYRGQIEGWKKKLK